jgi:hypothetical protein
MTTNAAGIELPDSVVRTLADYGFAPDDVLERVDRADSFTLQVAPRVADPVAITFTKRDD